MAEVLGRTASTTAQNDRLHFPKCPQCGRRPPARRHGAGIAVLERLVQLARDKDWAFTRTQLATRLSSYQCRQCRSIVDVTVGDWLRS
jgi:ribosomal protein L37AE/L43A